MKESYSKEFIETYKTIFRSLGLNKISSELNSLLNYRFNRSGDLHKKEIRSREDLIVKIKSGLQEEPNPNLSRKLGELDLIFQESLNILKGREETKDKFQGVASKLESIKPHQPPEKAIEEVKSDLLTLIGESEGVF